MWNLLERYAMIKAALANALNIDLCGCAQVQGGLPVPGGAG